MNKYALLFFLLSSFSSFSQEEVVSISNDLKTSLSEINRTFASVNESNGDFSVYLEDADSVYGYLFNSKYESISQLKTEDLRNKYKMFLGSTVDNLVHSTYFSNEKNTKFVTQSFDFENNSSSIKEINLSLENEMFLQSFTYNNTFYILSIVKNQSLINLYVFDKSNYTKNTVNLSEITFINWLNRKTSLHQLLLRDDGLSKIVNDVPSSLINSFKYSKLYLNNNKIILTLDQRFQYTEIISINLKDYTHTYNTINHNQEDNAALKFKRSNSFLVDSILFQASIIKEKFVFSIKNLNSNETLKESNFTRDKMISFENTNAVLDKKDKKRTKRFLRRATNTIVGIDVKKQENAYQIELGSYRLAQSGGVAMPTMGFGTFAMNSPGNVTFTPGTPSFSFSSYGMNSSVDSNTTEVVLDDKFEFESDKLSDNVFDKIEKFSEEKSDFVNSENIFQYKNYMFYCAALENSKGFLIVKFKN